jgi:hypothetical protein
MKGGKMEGGILCFCFSIYIIALVIAVYTQKDGLAQKRRKTWWEEYRDGK